MQVKDLEDLRKSLEILIDKAKSSKRDINLIELEKTAFRKFQIYIDGCVGLSKRKIQNTIDKKEKHEASSDLGMLMYVKKHLEIFVEHQMQDEREKINLH